MRGKRQNQAGNIPVFIIVGVLLTALLVGGIYLIRHNSTSAGNNPTVSKKEEAAKEDQKTETDKAEQERRQQEAEQKRAEEQRAAEQKRAEDQKTAEAEQKAAQEKQAAEQKQAADQKAAAAANQNQVAANNKNIPHTGASTPQAAEELPQTGPAEDRLFAMIGVALVVGAGVAYRKSQQSITSKFLDL